MSRVLVTGANGFVGRALCPALAAAGHQVTAAVRAPGGDGVPGAATVVPIADVGPETDWRQALDGAGAVVHLAARVHVMEETAPDPWAAYGRVNTEGTRRLAEQAAAAGVARMVLLSTVKVLGESTPAEPFREDDAPAPADAYAVSKWRAEQALLDIAARTGMDAVVLRPPLVYGPGVGGNFLRLLALCQKAPPLPLGGVANRRSMIYVGNLVDAVARCLDHPSPPGPLFLVRDGEDVSTPELIRRAAGALGRPARLFPVPAAVLRMAGAAVGRSGAVARLLDSLAVDDGKIRRELDWSPPFTMARGLGETATWFASRAGN